jgi:hypothetical protein
MRRRDGQHREPPGRGRTARSKRAARARAEAAARSPPSARFAARLSYPRKPAMAASAAIARPVSEGWRVCLAMKAPSSASSAARSQSPRRIPLQARITSAWAKSESLPCDLNPSTARSKNGPPNWHLRRARRRPGFDRLLPSARPGLCLLLALSSAGRAARGRTGHPRSDGGRRL